MENGPQEGGFLVGHLNNIEGLCRLLGWRLPRTTLRPQMCEPTYAPKFERDDHLLEIFLSQRVMRVKINLK
jgi:hypothetical protein